MKKNNGNAFIIAIVFVAIALSIIMFMCVVFFGEVNSLAHNIKLDMYSINKSAVISVNKGITSRNSFSYSKEAYKKSFVDLIKKNYSLNDNLKGSNGLVRSVDILQYEIYSKGKTDDYTNSKTIDTIIHSVIRVIIRPVLNIKMLESMCTFEIHEDVALNELVT